MSYQLHGFFFIVYQNMKRKINNWFDVLFLIIAMSFPKLHAFEVSLCFFYLSTKLVSMQFFFMTRLLSQWCSELKPNYCNKCDIFGKINIIACRWYDACYWQFTISSKNRQYNTISKLFWGVHKMNARPGTTCT